MKSTKDMVNQKIPTEGEENSPVYGHTEGERVLVNHCCQNIEISVDVDGDAQVATKERHICRLGNNLRLLKDNHGRLKVNEMNIKALRLGNVYKQESF